MRIAYIVATCEKYIPTRVKYLKKTCLQYVDKNDIYFLSCKSDETNRIFGWDTSDEYNDLPFKYIEFFKNMNLDYDWYFFMDDDTFVFPNHLEKLIKDNGYNPNENYYIGKILDHVEHEWGIYLSGGAGRLVSKSLYQNFIYFIRWMPIESIHRHWCEDLNMGTWVQEINKTQQVFTLNNNDFHIEMDDSENEIYTAITFHHLKKEKHYYHLNKYLDQEWTTIVLVTDANYFLRTAITIQDIRVKGNWKGEIQVITTDFDLSKDYKDGYNVKELKFPQIETYELLEKIGPNGFSDGDGRELNKLTQWEKLHVFDDYFCKWKRVIFMDSGIRVFYSINNLLDLEFKGKFVCPNDLGDGPEKNENLFHCQISKDKPELIEELVNEFGEKILNSAYFLNCIWIYDTDILQVCKKEDMIETMNKYPIFKTNEMGIMNLLLNFKHGLWQPFPWKAPNGKYLFDWSDYNHPGSKPDDYCFLKYPSIGLGPL